MQLTGTLPRRRSGFTLLEVLVVVVVLALLAALLFPVFHAVRRQAAASTCTSHLRQIGMACSMYAQDFGVYPDPPNMFSAVKENELLFCPNDDRSEGLGSSYVFRGLITPDLLPYWKVPDLDPNTVILTCPRHTGAEFHPRRAPSRLVSADFPYVLALRASGSVQPIATAKVRSVAVSGSKPGHVYAYPGEPGYDLASR